MKNGTRAAHARKNRSKAGKQKMRAMPEKKAGPYRVILFFMSNSVSRSPVFHSLQNNTETLYFTSIKRGYGEIKRFPDLDSRKVNSVHLNSRAVSSVGRAEA
jgi:hypothetical protein